MNNTANEYFASVARNVSSSRYLYKVDVIARVEDKEDIAFWQQMISANRTIKVKFLPAELNDSGMKQTGKTICMRYARFYNKHYIACVDSDFDKILAPKRLSSKKCILQTHTYSWENHYCQINQLTKKWNAKKGVLNFDFEMFLNRLSCILYPILIEMLAMKYSKHKGWGLEDLCGVILSCQPNKNGCLDNNGDGLLREISQKVNNWRSNRTKTPTADAIDEIKTRATLVGWSENNTYLYMQGHCIFDLLLRIGSVLFNDNGNFQYEVLQNDLIFTGYPEVDSIQNDIAELFG